MMEASEGLTPEQCEQVEQVYRNRGLAAGCTCDPQFTWDDPPTIAHTWHHESCKVARVAYARYN